LSTGYDSDEKVLIADHNLPSLFAGWIDDDSDDVGKVHLGAVFLCRLPPDQPLSLRSGTEDIHEEGWFSAGEILNMAGRCEQWTVLAVELAAGKRASI